MKQNPFSLYDFMGYFVPGAALLYGFVIIDALDKGKSGSFSDNLALILNNLPKLTLEGIILMLIVSYAVGHILSFLSSISIERYAVWMYGYPSRNLLGISRDKKIKDRFNEYDLYGKIRMITMILIICPTVLFDLFCGHILKFNRFYS